MLAAIPKELEAVLTRQVRLVARESTNEAQALLWIAAGEKKDWTPEEWRALLDELDSCHDTVADWLNTRWLG